MNQREIDILLGLFKNELIEMADQWLDCLDQWNEPGVDRDKLLKTAKRIAHNIKGNASTVGNSQIVDLAHEAEDWLDEIASKKADLEQYRDAIVRHISTMLAVADDRSAVMANSIQPSAPAKSSSGRLPSKDAPDTASKPKEAATLGKKPSIQPEIWQSPAVEEKVAVNQEAVVSRRTTSLRVDTTRLDHVLSFTGELFATEAMLVSLNGRLKRLVSSLNESVATGSMTEVKTICQQLSLLARDDMEAAGSFNRLANDLTASMKRLRMIPLRDEAAKWRMTTRTCAEQLGKKAKLELRGEEVELDKSVLERLEEPMVHLLRNAVDHGLESSETRRQAGKPEYGKIRLTASVNGSIVNITLEDDGRGLDRQRIGEVAISRGVLSRDKLAQMSDTEVYALIFAQGFSTAEQVSTLSGRGIGLSAARSALREFGGTLEVENSTELGGACFRLGVPVSVLSTKALLIRSGRTTLALPVERVEQLVRPRTDELVMLEGESAVKIDDSGPIRVRWLNELFERDEKELESAYCTIMVVSIASGRLGLVVDEVFGEEELVVQSLPWNLGAVHGVAGTVVLANNEVALVLDPEAFSETANVEARMITDRARARRVLIVDDSLVARTLMSNTLTGAGFEVKLAVDGAQAWELLQQGTFDLVVSDIKMPGVDGFDLTAKIRADKKRGALPIILVTSLTGQEYRKRGLEMGANEFIVKGAMEQEKLLSAVARLLAA